MKIAIGSDHAGFALKEEIRSFLTGRGLDVTDLGPSDGQASVDYPDFASAVARSVAGGDTDRGILICGTGIGMSMTANRVPGIRAALCHDHYTARMCRAHNDANVLCIGSRVSGASVALEMAAIFLETEFEGGRHRKRVNKIHATEKVETP